MLHLNTPTSRPSSPTRFGRGEEVDEGRRRDDWEDEEASEDVRNDSFMRVAFLGQRKTY